MFILPVCRWIVARGSRAGRQGIEAPPVFLQHVSCLTLRTHGARRNGPLIPGPCAQTPLRGDVASRHPARPVETRNSIGDIGKFMFAPRNSGFRRLMRRLVHLRGPLLSFVLCLSDPCAALDLSPRLWNHLPVGMNFGALAYSHTDADIYADPALRLEDVQAELHAWVGKYIRTFEVAGKSARIDITQAYLEGHWQGLVNSAPHATSRDGWSDTFVRFAVNLYGAPPLDGKAFAKYHASPDPKTIVGTGLVVRLPTGEYKERKLINLGENWFAFRPQIGAVHTRGRWTVEATGEVGFFTKNDDFFNGNTLRQKPIFTAYSHVSYTFRPGLRLGASVGFDDGGAHTVNGVDKNDKRSNFGWAFSGAFPLSRNAGLNVSYINTHAQESVGFDSDSLSASLSVAW